MDFIQTFNLPSQASPFVFFLIMLWSLFALWTAAKTDQRNWFIAMLIINTVGILDIIYLFRFAKKKMTLGDLYFWKSKS